MRTSPPPYSPAAMVPSKAAYSSGWSSVGTASRLGPVVVGGPLGTAQLLRTPSRSRRRSQWTRSPVPRGMWCSWTTKVSPPPAGRGASADGTGSAVRAGSRLARYSARGSSRRPRGRAGTSGGAAGALGRRLVRRGLLGGRGLLGRGLLRRRGRARRALPGCRLPGRPLLRLLVGGRARRPLGGGGLLRGGPPGRWLLGGSTAGLLDAAAQRAHQVHDRGTGLGGLGQRLHLAAGLLGLQQRGHRLAVVVGELRGVELAGHRGD